MVCEIARAAHQWNGAGVPADAGLHVERVAYSVVRFPKRQSVTAAEHDLGIVIVLRLDRFNGRGVDRDARSAWLDGEGWPGARQRVSRCVWSWQLIVGHGVILSKGSFITADSSAVDDVVSWVQALNLRE